MKRVPRKRLYDGVDGIRDCVSPAEFLSEPFGGTRCHVQERDQGIERPKSWGRSDFIPGKISVLQNAFGDPSISRHSVADKIAAVWRVEGELYREA